MHMKDKIKLALAQIASKREDKQDNLRRIEELTIKAKEQGCRSSDFSGTLLDRVCGQRPDLRISRNHPRTFNAKNRASREGNGDVHYLWDAGTKRKDTGNRV